MRLIPREEYDRIDGGSGNEAGFYPQEGAPYGIELREWRNSFGLPCWAPPFGTVAATRSGQWRAAL
jgi:quinoprotein glucose dehydrogenase